MNGNKLQTTERKLDVLAVPATEEGSAADGVG